MEVVKKDFELKSMEVKIISKGEVKIVEGMATQKGYGIWTYVCRTANVRCDGIMELSVIDDPGKLFTFVRPLT